MSNDEVQVVTIDLNDPSTGGLAGLLAALGGKTGKSQTQKCWDELQDAMVKHNYDREVICMHFHGFKALVDFSGGQVATLAHLAEEHQLLSAAKAAMAILEFLDEAHRAIDAAGQKLGVDAVRCFSIDKLANSKACLRKVCDALEAKHQLATSLEKQA